MIIFLFVLYFRGSSHEFVGSGILIAVSERDVICLVGMTLDSQFACLVRVREKVVCLLITVLQSQYQHIPEQFPISEGI